MLHSRFGDHILLTSENQRQLQTYQIKNLLSNFKIGLPTTPPLLSKILTLLNPNKYSQQTHLNFLFKPSNFPSNPLLLFYVNYISFFKRDQVWYTFPQTKTHTAHVFQSQKRFPFLYVLVIFYLHAFNFENQNQNWKF